MVECLRLCASTAVGVSSIPGQSEEGSRKKKKIQCAKVWGEGETRGCSFLQDEKVLQISCITI